MKRKPPVKVLVSEKWGIVLIDRILGPFTSQHAAITYRNKYCGRVDGRLAKVLPIERSVL